jgi:hemoglobin-like flavoprotein
MGSAASIAVYESDSGKSDDVDRPEFSSKRTSVTSFFSLTRYLEPSRPDSKPAVDIYKKSVCEASWENIKTFVGIKPFAALFFQIFIATDESICAKFRPHARVKQRKYSTKEGLLTHLVEYLLSIEDDSFDTKKKIRALGRKHIISGIRKHHIRVFNDVLITTLLNIPDIRECLITMSAWTGLLDFVATEMYIEDIQLMDRWPALEMEEIEGVGAAGDYISVK